jgi:hypothetical protein
MFLRLFVESPVADSLLPAGGSNRNLHAMRKCYSVRRCCGEKDLG